MRTSKAKGIELRKLVMLLNNMPRQSGAGTPNQMFYRLRRANTDQTVLAENRMNMREKTREMNDKGPKPDLRQFKVGDKVSLYDENSGIGRLQAL